jgi:ATP-dependent RNA helicase DeaD
MPKKATTAAKPEETTTPAETPAETPGAPEPEAAPITFDDLGLSEPVRRAITDAGYESPTPIQSRAIPVMLAGRDLIGQAQTGTGKTAAFALPILDRVDAARNDTQALILAPTRELAVQVAGEFHNFAKHTSLRVVPVYGGQPIDRQLRALRQGAHVVVGTPGRIQDHLRRGSLDLSKVAICVLDEADEMLALGFVEEVEAILAELPEERQVSLFSATMPPRVAALARKFLREPERVAIESKRRTVEKVDQSYYEVPKGRKLEALARVLDMETPGPTIVFCRTRKETEELAEALRVRGYGAESLHGEMAQQERDRVMKRFRDGQSDLLIATDVAARGLDIETVTHVVNYDIPWDVEQYIHRIGRTGRAGREGDAITLVEPRERRLLRQIEFATGAKIRAASIPTAADISARRRELMKNAVLEALEAGNFDGQMAIIDELGEQYNLGEVAAAALQILWESWAGNPAEVEDEIAAQGEQPEAGMTRLFLAMGRQDGLRPGDLVGAITNETGLPGKSVGAIDILDRTAFVEVPAENAREVIEALSKTKLRGRRVRVDIAQPMARGGREGGRDGGDGDGRGRFERGGRPDRGGRPERPRAPR